MLNKMLNHNLIKQRSLNRNLPHKIQLKQDLKIQVRIRELDLKTVVGKCTKATVLLDKIQVRSTKEE
jgi:hypothetical protein